MKSLSERNSVFNLRTVRTKTVYAFVDAEMEVDGVRFRISGIQARHVTAAGTSVHLPCYRDIDGTWRAAIDLPDEVRDALASSVLEFLLEQGVASRRAGSIAIAEGQAAE